MSYEPYETSAEGSEPIELFTFAIGEDPPYYYTTAEDAITIGGNEYLPVPISRTSVELNSEDVLSPIEISLPADNEFAQKYIAVPPGLDALCTVDRLQRDDVAEELQREFFGAIHTVKFSDDFQRAILGAFWTVAKNNRQIPRFTFGSPCNYIVGDPATCKVDLEDPAFKHTGQAQTQVGRVLTVTGIYGNFDDGWFTGGTVRSVTFAERRMVTAHVGNDLTLLLPFPDDILGTNMEVRAGCDHDWEGDCATKFDQTIEYGGWPFVPPQNPFVVGVD